MSPRLRVFIALAAAVLLIMLIRMIKKKKIDLRESLIWFALCFLIIVFDAFPIILNELADFFGIAVPSNMIFMAAILLLVITIFILTTKISDLYTKTRRLTQEIALLETEVGELSKRQQRRDENCLKM